MQIPIIKELIGHLGFALIEKEGLEADDLIAFFTEKALAQGWKVVIVSQDKDIYQLLEGERVVIFNPAKDEEVRENDFLAQYGFKPRHIVDYLALAGDATDNIPGARGIGKVGAGKLIAEFSTIENIFDNITKVPPQIGEKLKKSEKMVRLSKELAQLSGNRGVDFSLQDLEVSESDYGKLRERFRELEFTSLLKEVPSSGERIAVEVKEGLPEHIKQAITERLFFSFDQEYIYVCCGEQTVYKDRLVNLKNILEDSAIEKISYEMKSLFKAGTGIPLGGRCFDVMLAAYLLDVSLGDYTIETLATHFLDCSLQEASEAVKAYLLFRLFELFDKRLPEAGLDKLFFDIEMPLVEVLARMEEKGVHVDCSLLEKLLAMVNKKAQGLTKEISTIAGIQFNLNSPKQLSDVLFNRLTIKPIKRTKTGFSTNEEVLKVLSKKHPIAGLILEYRHLTKLSSTYLAPFLEDSQKNRGMIHAQFNQTGTQTGRLSSSNPNLQNIPARGDLASLFRRAFIPCAKKRLLVAADYSQIELRILAHLSKDPTLVNAFEHDVDIHRLTASVLFDKKEAAVTPDERDIAKRINFSIIYGMSDFGLARELEVTIEEAAAFIESYFSRYPKVKDFIDVTIKEARRNGLVKTSFGRIRVLRDINSDNRHLKDFSERQAVNTPIQGFAADLIKLAMIKIYRQLHDKQLSSYIIMQIHDELIFDVAKGELDSVVGIVKENMEQVTKLVVPLKVKVQVGANWEDMEEVQ